MQAILNIRREIDDLRFKEGKRWDDHLNKFQELLNNMATYDEEVSNKEKASKLIRNLPEACNGLAVMAQLQGLKFEKLVQVMYAEISRRKNLKDKPQEELEAAKVAKIIKKPGNTKITRSTQKKTELCFVCDKTGHYARECWHRNGSSFSGRGRGRECFLGRGRKRDRFLGLGRGRGFHYEARNYQENFMNQRNWDPRPFSNSASVIP